METKLTKRSATEFLEDNGYVVLTESQFKKLNRNLNNTRQRLTAAENAIPTIRADVGKTGAKAVTKIETSFEKINEELGTWTSWFVINGGEDFEPKSSSTLATSTRPFA